MDTLILEIYFLIIKISNFWEDLTDTSAKKDIVIPGVDASSANEQQQCFCFQNQIKHFLDILIQKILIYMTKINNFRGDLTSEVFRKSKSIYFWIL